LIQSRIRITGLPVLSLCHPIHPASDRLRVVDLNDFRPVGDYERITQATEGIPLKPDADPKQMTIARMSGFMTSIAKIQSGTFTIVDSLWSSPEQAPFLNRSAPWGYPG
jgi:hypothetical protein